jgi:hypothetical protein
VRGPTKDLRLPDRLRALQQLDRLPRAHRVEPHHHVAEVGDIDMSRTPEAALPSPALGLRELRQEQCLWSCLRVLRGANIRGDLPLGEPAPIKAAVDFHPVVMPKKRI